jgi:RimJ/RimL family protein N-acetyltransferase
MDDGKCLFNKKCYDKCPYYDTYETLTERINKCQSCKHKAKYSERFPSVLNIIHDNHCMVRPDDYSSSLSNLYPKEPCELYESKEISNEKEKFKPTIELRVPIENDLYHVLGWRHTIGLQAYRTPYELTSEMQEKFYNEVINNRNSNTKFYSIYTENEFTTMSIPGGTDRNIKTLIHAGMVGLENIDYINGNAEISLVVDPSMHGKGIGTQAVHEILRIAFNQLRLNSVYGECYMCNPAKEFWKKIINKYDCQYAGLKDRKYFDGQYWDSLYFTIEKMNFQE